MTERQIAEVLQAVPRIPWCTRCDIAVVYEREARRWCQRCSNMSTIVHRPDHDAMARAVVERVVGPLKTSLARLESSTHCTICNRPHYHYGVGR